MSLVAESPDLMDKPKTLSVKLHMDVIESARVASALRGETMTDMLSDILRPILKEMEKTEITRRFKSVNDSGAKKPKSKE